MITESIIARIMPRCANPRDWAHAFERACSGQFPITDPADRAAFLAQVAHESSELTRLEENLSYTAERLVQVWPSRFKSVEFAKQYERKPQLLADYVYGGRLGNGPPESGDGWRYRGRGPIQLTGKTNYVRFGEAIGEKDYVVKCPDVLLTKAFGALAAAWFWTENRLSFLALDNPGDDREEDFRTITRRINGGLHGLDARKRYWNLARQAFDLPIVS
jgi:putative chitinase